MPSEPPDCEKIVLLMPIRFPEASISAPPELPGLIAASVWMKSSNRLMPRWLRPSALTMPDGHRVAEAERIADREHRVADLHVLDRAQRDRREAGGVCLQDGEIGLGVGAADLRLQAATVLQHELDVVGAFDDVLVGEHVAVG